MSAPSGTSQQGQLRLWPGLAAVAVQWLVLLGVPLLSPRTSIYAIGGGVLGGLLVLIWWLFFSRAPWRERLGAVALMVAVMAVTPPILHPSIATGLMSRLFPILAIPMLSLALVIWAVACRRLSGMPRYAALAGAVVAACGSLALVRTDGITGGAKLELAWRWTPTHEQLLLAAGSRAALPAALPAAVTPAAATPPVVRTEPEPKPVPARRNEPKSSSAAAPPPPAGPDWPGFRGARRDGVVRGTRIRTDWAAAPPVELWRRAVGPGWSSFAVSGGLLYTQEQRGESEVVVCHRLSDGEPVWAHRDATRFWESNGGAGPRGTPTLSGGRVYALGATGILNALDAATGALVWTHNVAVDTGAQLPGWGFSSSPLVVEGMVIVAASGRMAGYDRDTGDKRWDLQTGGGSYSSPHRFTIGGVTQVVLLSGPGATSVSPADGKVLWKHEWPGSTIVQPAMTSDGDLLITTGTAAGGTGTRRLSVLQGPGGWTAQERWTSNGLKPYFNDTVVHKGHAFGFDGSILSCIDLRDGSRKWKGGRYGYGQMILLADQDLLLVLSEEGEVALVAAAGGQYTEVARFRAIEGKTWNHPALAGDTLLVRNGEEMAAFRLVRGSE